ncbi:MAG: branched-chain-amino-acid transaminase [Gammaproteobacteria bacterium]|nr:branched-chain-amino-acid transaminase [Gammaproteobacteria bacterium]
MSSQAVCWLDGRIVPAAEATVSVFDHGLLYGDGVFEGVRYYRRTAFRLEEHLERLALSARAIALALPYTMEQLADAVRETIAASTAEDGYLRVVITRGGGAMGLDPRGCARPTVFIIALQLQLADAAKRRDGLRAIIAATRRLPPDGLDPRIKSLNYLNHVLARIEASHAGADEAILLNAAGRVAEGTADNVFVVRKGRILTPPAVEGALEGVTRGVVFELAHAAGIEAVEAPLAPYDLYTAEECFLTGTAMELAPVAEIDGRRMTVCPGPVYRRLERNFRALVQGEMG